MGNPNQETLEKWHQDPNNWKWSMFYYNPKDRRVLVPKRNKWMGWTTNFAYLPSVLLLVIVLASAILAIYFGVSSL
ncbi:hypothetical protein G4D82_04095 [Flavobacterium sp. CYK-4]|uniref:DUF5808 domain-containing protein n=1 Tax=Flavobacterium lotistagni TaxID=2709660 RepID=UPI00140DAF27|nr:DUF5808 domain-containing protein [Flavobacterium lotistagni]NHM06391.1 hypothetical protein [Flavobacterium lotistagni]